jgi:hypothetical protein
MNQIAEYVKFPALAGSRAAQLRARLRRWALITAAILVVAVSGLRAMPVPVRAATGGTVVSQTLVAGPYTLTLRIGPPLPLWSPEQARTKHPRNGDIIRRGPNIILLGPMARGSVTTPNYHLDLHVALRSLGTVIRNVVVAITVTTPTGTVVQRVPVALSQGVRNGPSDIHFGNNISLKPGHYLIVVQVKRTTATFAVALAT